MNKLKLPKKKYFIDLFKDESEVFEEFQANEKDQRGVDIILAYYSYENYVGEAEVIFAKDNKLFIVKGYHCSCHGLAGQWEPVETSWETIEKMHKDGTYGEYFESEMEEILTELNL